MSKKIEFVSYSGKYPTLCLGKLVVKIDGQEVSFGCTYRRLVDSDEEVAKYPSFWESGGSTGFDDNWNEVVIGGSWEMSKDVDEKDYPPEIWKSLPDILVVMNENVPGGCCGGCL